MKHSRHSSNAWTPFYLILLLLVVYGACNNNTQPSEATTRVYLDIEEGQAMSTDSLHPDNALMYRGKDGIPHVSYNFSK